MYIVGERQTHPPPAASTEIISNVSNCNQPRMWAHNAMHDNNTSLRQVLLTLHSAYFQSRPPIVAGS